MNWEQFRWKVADWLAIKIGGSEYTKVRIGAAALSAHCLKIYSPEQSAMIIYEFRTGKAPSDELVKAARVFDDKEDENVPRG